MLALWAYNYNWSGSSSTTATASVSISPSVPYVSGKGKANNTYQMLDEDYWEAREASLVKATAPSKSAAQDTELSPVRIATLAPNPSPASNNRAETLAAFKNASSVDEMRSISAKLRNMT